MIDGLISNDYLSKYGTPIIVNITDIYDYKGDIKYLFTENKLEGVNLSNTAITNLKLKLQHPVEEEVMLDVIENIPDKIEIVNEKRGPNRMSTAVSISLDIELKTLHK
mmetsp:Transcript_5547/g.4744  ORF Transcript_5547/g.4744 Transcript_5547/m.4744 type:complete len:108 (-) Transcript_5547:271-594(-)